MKNPGTGSPYCKGCGKLITETGGVDSLAVCCSHQTFVDGTHNGGYCKQCCPTHGGRETMEDTNIVKAITAMEKVEKHRPSMINVPLIESQKAIAYALIDIAMSLAEIQRCGIRVVKE